jgi:hypothetical protein
MSVPGVITNGLIGLTDMMDQSHKNALDVSDRVGMAEKKDLITPTEIKNI